MAIKKKKVAVFGDTILDIFTYYTSPRLSPEAPVPIIIENRRDYFAGGAGLLFSNGCLKKLHPHFESMENIWYDVWEKSKIYFKPQRGISKGASDVAVCQFMQQRKINTRLVIEKNFYHCNYLGLPCINHRLHKKPNIHEIVSCHQMSLQDFDAYYNLIKDS